MALTIVVLAALFLVGLAVASFFAPANAIRFLSGFAGSARAHYTEVFIRFIAGSALVVSAPRMLFGDIFLLFGWVLMVTSWILLLLPWRWHQKFARIVVPPLTRQVWLFGVLSLLLGGVILFSVLSVGSG